MSRRMALCLGGVSLLWLCVIAGCEAKPASPPLQTDLVLSAKEITVVQGYGETVFTGGANEVDKIEGQKDGVTATIKKNGFIDVNAAKDAKVGQVNLIVTKAGKTALLKVTIKEPVNTLVGSIMAHPRVEVEQGQEATVPYFIEKTVTSGKGDISITEAKDGLTAKAEPGENGFGFKVSAAKDAKPGFQELTIKAGNDTLDTLRVTVKAAAAK